MPMTSCQEARVVAQGSNHYRSDTHTSTPTLTIAGVVESPTTIGNKYTTRFRHGIWNYTSLPLFHSLFDPFVLTFSRIVFIVAWHSPHLALHCMRIMLVGIGLARA